MARYGIIVNMKMFRFENIRITSGELRGRIIRSPKSDLVHPMGAREKLALFNMVADFLPKAEVLDAFAGSGALGIEAISRGAKSVTFIEKDVKVAQNLMENLKRVGISSADIDICKVKEFRTNREFDIIIADPPYDNFEVSDIIYLTNYLKDGGVFVLSHPGDTPVIDGLKLTKSRKYAGATLSIYQK